MPYTQIWTRLPGGTKLEVAVTPEVSPYVSSATLVTSPDGTVDEWIDGDISPGPTVVKKLVAGKAYGLVVDLFFLGAQVEVTVEVRAVKPDGSTKRFRHQETGKKEHIASFHVIATTAKA